MSYNPYLLLLPIIILAMIYKHCLKKGGIKFKIDGFFPNKVGIREKDSKWAPVVSNIGLIATIALLIDMWVRFIQQEAEKIPALGGGG